jgi:hypothetical protein
LEKEMRDYIEEDCDSIDASVFNGDDFMKEESRKRLRWYMERWERKLKEWEEISKEFEKNDTSTPYN